jgi:hypothetical protein
MTWLALLPLLVLAIWLSITPIERWIKAHARNQIEGNDITVCSTTCAWGTIRCLTSSRYDSRYFYLKLPSFAWERDYCRNEYRWHQRVLWWSSYRGWGVQIWPCDRT